MKISEMPTYTGDTSDMWVPVVINGNKKIDFKQAVEMIVQAVLAEKVGFEDVATRADISNRTDTRQIHVEADETENGAETWLFYKNGTLKIFAFLL